MYTVNMQEFFKAAEEGSIERLEELFDTIDTADPNMTQVRKRPVKVTFPMII